MGYRQAPVVVATLSGGGSQEGLDPQVLLAFGLKPKRIEPMRGAFRVDEPQGTCVLKKYRQPAEDLLFIRQVQQHLAKQGFERFSRLCVNHHGDLGRQVGEDTWILNSWVEGRESDYDRSRDLTAVVMAVAEFHQASRGFYAPEYNNRSYWGRWPSVFTTKIEQIEECRRRAGQKEYLSVYDRLYLEHVDRILEEAKEAFYLLSISPYPQLMEQEAAQGGFCHHDLAHHNVITSPEGQAYFLDFDYCIQDTRLHDLASLMIRALKRQRWSIEKGIKILEAYHQIYPFTDSELVVLLSFLAFPNDFWQYGWAYYVEKLDCPPDYHYKRLKRFLNNQKYRCKFLQEFASGI